MACGATLKRTYEFDPLHSPHSSPKRRRCSPMTLATLTPPAKSHQIHDSPFGEVSPRLTPERVAASITMEIRRMQKRRQLTFNPALDPASSLMPTCDIPSTSSCDIPPASTSQAATALFNALSPSKRDMPLFTFKQVGMICERLLKEREQVIGEQYNKVLNDKLAEQYEAFLKFNHDQLHRRFNNAEASYVS